MDISVVIPLYNDSNGIKTLVKSILTTGLSVVVVDDGSSKSELAINDLKGLSIIRHSVNLGKGAAMKTGANFAFKKGRDAVIFMDADGQHSTRDLYKFTDALRIKKVPIVLGTRYDKKQMPFVRLVGNKLASSLISVLFGIKSTDPLCGFRAITKDCYNKIIWDSRGYGVELEMLANISKNHINFLEVPVRTIYLDKDKGVTVLDSFGVLIDILKWKLTK
jgi:polyprenyl-phospho-N-acetylgalactosaminyl synthase